jgi:hypothetical protein
MEGCSGHVHHQVTAMLLLVCYLPWHTGKLRRLHKLWLQCLQSHGHDDALM